MKLIPEREAGELALRVRLALDAAGFSAGKPRHGWKYQCSPEYGYRVDIKYVGRPGFRGIAVSHVGPVREATLRRYADILYRAGFETVSEPRQPGEPSTAEALWLA